MDQNEFRVYERDFSWGTLATVYRDGVVVMFVDLYNDGTYRVVEK